MMDVVLNWDLCLKVSSRDDVGIIRMFPMEPHFSNRHLEIINRYLPGTTEYRTRTEALNRRLSNKE